MTTCLFCDIVQGMQEIPLSEDLALQAKKFLQKTSFSVPKSENIGRIYILLGMCFLANY